MGVGCLGKSVKRSFVATLLLALVVRHGGAVDAQRPAPTFRTGVDLVSLSVTVTSGSGGYATDLLQDDFQVLENGVPQKLVFFGKGDVPVALALLLDSSASMEAMLATAQEAAIGFIRQLRPADLASVIDFDSRVQTLHDFSGDPFLLEEAIRRTKAGGATALYNAMYIALKELSRFRVDASDDATTRRKAMVVLSDGEDTSSLISFDEVLEVASRSDTVVYPIGLGQAASGGTRRPDEGQFILRQLAQRTGGRAFFAGSADDLADVYRLIRDELASQYLLAYESTSSRRDGKWRAISVRVKRAGVAVRSRQGYVAPAK